MDPLRYDGVGITHRSSRFASTTVAASTPNVSVALQCLDGKSYLTSTCFPCNPTVFTPQMPDIVQHIRACHHRMAIIDKHETWLTRLFSKTIVGTAELQQVGPRSLFEYCFPATLLAPCALFQCSFPITLVPQSIHQTDTDPAQRILPPSPSARCRCHRVYLSNFEYQWILTETFHKPDTHRGKLIYTTAPRERGGNTLQGQRIITLRKVLDKTRVCRMLIVMVVISPSLGVLVGHLADSAEAGIAASAAVCVIASFIQLLTAWVLG